MNVAEEVLLVLLVEYPYCIITAVILANVRRCYFLQYLKKVARFLSQFFLFTQCDVLPLPHSPSEIHPSTAITSLGSATESKEATVTVTT